MAAEERAALTPPLAVTMHPIPPTAIPYQPEPPSFQEREAAAQVATAEERLTALQTAHEEAPPGYEHETYAELEKYYQEEYLPIHQRLSGIQEARQAEQWDEFSSELRKEGLTEREIASIKANFDHISQTSRTDEEAQQRWEKFFDQWERTIETRHRAEVIAAERAKVKPAWAVVKESPIGKFPLVGEVVTGYVRGWDPIGKWAAERVVGRPIETVPAIIRYGAEDIRLLPRRTPLEIGGEILSQYALFRGVGLVAGGVARGVGPMVAKAVKIVTVTPISKLAPRISPVVAAKWTGYGVKAVGVGKFVAAHPKAVTYPMYGLIGSMEVRKAYEMYEAGATLEEIAATVGKDVAAIVGFGRGFVKGLKAEPPVGISRVKVGEKPIYTGLRIGQRPIIGKTPEGWALGMPKYTPETVRKFLGYAYKAGYAPGTMFETRLVTRGLFPGLEKITPGEYPGAMKSWGLRLATRGAAPLTKKNLPTVMGEVFGRQKISDKAFRRALAIMQKEKGLQVYGMTAKEAQMKGIYPLPEEYAFAHDIDVMVRNAPGFAERVVKAINKIQPGAAWVKTSMGGTPMIMTKYGKLFDVHAIGVGYGAPSVKWGLGAEPKIKISGFKVPTISEETTRAWWSIGALREVKGKVMFWPEAKRVKDIWRFLGAEAELAISKGVPAKFPPVEKFWMGKLKAMGYTPQQMERMAAQVAKEPSLLYSAPLSSMPGVSFPISPIYPSYEAPSPPSYAPPSYPSYKLPSYLSYKPSKASALVTSIGAFLGPPSPPYKPSKMPSISPPSIGYMSLSYPPSYPSPYPSPPPSFPPGKPLPPIMRLPREEWKPSEVEAKAKEWWKYRLIKHPLGSIMELLYGRPTKGKKKAEPFAWAQPIRKTKKRKKK